MGISLRDIIFDIGGGIPKGKKFKAVQTGGPSGGCIPESLLDLPVDYDELTKAGSMMGSGGMIVMDEDTCMVDVARYFLDFLKDESCGKCVPCREGIKQMLAILERICRGEGREEDIEILQEIGTYQVDTSLCALGQTAANPVLSTIRYFRSEYEEHIHDRHCAGGRLQEPSFATASTPTRATGCMACLKPCPAKAIDGRAEEAPRHTAGAVHHVRRLLRHVQVLGDRQGAHERGRGMSAVRRGSGMSAIDQGSRRPRTEAMHLVIDGKAIKAERGQTILEAAKAAGIGIPTLCHHPTVEAYGACRLCIVEIAVRGRGRLVTSCNYEAAEGLEVQTDSERVTKSRRMTIELLLARCPEVDALQRLAKAYGVQDTRFPRGEGRLHPLRPVRAHLQRAHGRRRRRLRGTRRADARGHPLRQEERGLHHLRRLRFRVPDAVPAPLDGSSPRSSCRGPPSSTWGCAPARPSTSPSPRLSPTRRSSTGRTACTSPRGPAAPARRSARQKPSTTSSRIRPWIWRQAR